MKHFINETKPVTEIAYSEPEFNPYEYIIISSLWWKKNDTKEEIFEILYRTNSAISKIV